MKAIFNLFFRPSTEVSTVGLLLIVTGGIICDRLGATVIAAVVTGVAVIALLELSNWIYYQFKGLFE